MRRQTARHSDDDDIVYEFGASRVGQCDDKPRRRWTFVDWWRGGAKRWEMLLMSE